MFVLVANAVQLERDWIDYLIVASALGSLVLAVLASWMAFRSKGDAQRSADAAEVTAMAAEKTTELTSQIEQRSSEQLQIMRSEHEAFMVELRRRPEIEPVLEFPPSAASRPLRVLVRSGANNAGARTAAGALVSIVVPRGVLLWKSNPQGHAREQLELEPQEENFGRDEAVQPADGFSFEADVRPGVREIAYYILEFPDSGIYKVAAHCFHHDIPGGRAWVIARLDLMAVPPQSEEVERDDLGTS